jgi:Protein of unknown function (DUF4232)
MTLCGSPRQPARPGRPAPLTRPAGLARARPARARLAGTGLAVAFLALLAACSGTGGQPQSGGASRLPAAGAHAAPSVLPSTTPAGSPSPAPATAPPVPAAGPPTGPAAGTPAPPRAAGGCASGALRVSVGTASGAAGSIYYPLDFRNTSAASCTLLGYPGVSFVASPGAGQLGGAAVRNPAFQPTLVTLAPGAVAHASVQVVVAQNYPASLCKPVTAHWLRVYPPGQFAPVYARLTAQTCTGAIPGGSTLGIYVVRPGANGP